MSQRTEDIKRKITEMFKGNDQVFQATIKEVNEDEFTCTVIFDDELEYTDVRIRAVIDSEKKGFCFIPSVDSIVQVGRLANSDQLYIALFSEIDKIIFTYTEDMEITFDTEKIFLRLKERSIEIAESAITFNGGDKNSFATDINKLVQKLNALENDLNTLKQLFITWIPAAFDGGAVLKGLTATWAGQTFTPTQVDNIKDELIKH